VFAVYKRYVYNCHNGQASLLNVLFTELMCGIVAQWLRFLALNQETMGSNPAETIFLLLTCLLTPQTLNTVVSSICVAIVTTIFSLGRNKTLDFRFGVLMFC